MYKVIKFINLDPQMPMSTGGQSATGKVWYEKMVEAIIGDAEGPHQKYALICQQCFEHNGLVLPEEYPTARKFL
jgi:hypothetical protein